MGYSIYSYKNGSVFKSIAACAEPDSGAGGSGRYDYDYDILDASPMRHLLGYTKDNAVYDACNSMVGLVVDGAVYEGTSSFGGTARGKVSGGVIFNSAYADAARIGEFDGPDVMGAAALLLMPDEFPSGSAGRSSSGSQNAGSGGSSGGSSHSRGSGGGGVYIPGGTVGGIIITVAVIAVIYLLWNFVFNPVGAFWNSLGLGMLSMETDSLAHELFIDALVPGVISFAVFFIVRAIYIAKGKYDRHRNTVRDIVLLILLFISLCDCTQYVQGEYGSIIMELFGAACEFGIYFVISMVWSAVMIPVNNLLRKQPTAKAAAPAGAPGGRSAAKPAQTPAAWQAPKAAVSGWSPAPAPAEDKIPNADPAPEAGKTAASADDVYAQLKKASEMHDKGILSDEEFSSLKAKLLSKI